MKKIISYLTLSFIFLFSVLLLLLTTIGIETEKFNNIISKKIYQNNKNINLELDKIRFKLDLKELSLFLQTSESKINYRDVTIPTKDIKVYIDFISLLVSKPKIEKINLQLLTLDIQNIKKLSSIIKPSNFSRILNNNIIRGTINAELEFFLNDKNNIDDFIIKGEANNLDANFLKDINLRNTKLSFFADRSDILIKSIFGELDKIKINDGDIKLRLTPNLTLESNFYSILKLEDQSLKKYAENSDNFKFAKSLKNIHAELNNNLLITFDETYKIKKFNFETSGEVNKVNLSFNENFKNDFLKDFNSLSIKNSKIKAVYASDKKNVSFSGNYSTDNQDFFPFLLNTDFSEKFLNVIMEFDFKKSLDIDLLNYTKKKNKLANISINFKKNQNKFDVKKIKFKENKNSILIEDLKIENNNFTSFKKIIVKTFKDGKKNNDFSILSSKKIKVSGNNFDASNLVKTIAKKSSKNYFKNFNKKIEIDFKNIAAPLANNLSNFKLIGEIKKGKFVKISAKGDYGNNNFLDISMKNDEKNNKQYLEIYSDLAQPLLTDYNFFKGLKGGNLLFNSIIDEKSSNSKLKIENFKILNAPGLVKLLSLADLSGLADLAQGEGLSFDTLEINMHHKEGFLTLNEIYALGPSISVIMEGYQDSTGLTSLRGTLIPAKNLNKIISKIPMIGNIVIPKEVGEGLFGISFKMKGPPGKIKTTINPIRTITPRFIQKILDKQKKTK